MSEVIEVSGKGRITAQVNVPDSLRANKGNRTYRILTQKDGDKRVVWDSNDLQQIIDAKTMFDECIQKGLVPYKVGTGGRATSEVMDEFDPDAEEVIFLPVAAVVGG